MTTRKEIADFIFPDTTQSIEELAEKYPARKEKTCSRFAPSPTGFMHIGGLFSALVSQRFVKQNDGVFFLRIEDTDQKREVKGAIDLIIDNFRFFGIDINEGPIGENNSDFGDYGPYTQSQRKTIYQVFAKTLIERGLAYPCWMTEKELEDTRNGQLKSKITPGIYSNYSVWRNKNEAEIMEKLKSDSNFVLRFRSHGDLSRRIEFQDLIRGKINMIDNYNDIVLIKSDGLPTYHLAHIADDFLMRTSHVIRGEEWLTSVPLHIQLFEAFGLEHPQYCHIAPLLKLDEKGNKRKLSKRHDPESNVDFFFQNGYAPEGIIDYLLTIVDPNYEEWQKNNPDKNYLDFQINIEKMNNSGALFDMTKLQNMNNAYLSRISTAELYNQSLIWAKKYNHNLARLLESDPEYSKSALNIERHTPKDPKRFTTFQDIENQILFFYDDEWEKLLANKPELPEACDIPRMAAFVEEYLQKLNLNMTLEDWFAQLKEVGKNHGFAGNNAEFKEGGFVGKVGDLAMFMRIALCASSKTPDLYSVMQVLGKERIEYRLRKILGE